jgi:hypothetical protein
MNESNIIAQLYEDHKALVTFLDEHEEPSLRSQTEANFAKFLLLAVASYFERQLTASLLLLAEAETKKDHPLYFFIKNKAIKRQYHTFFTWENYKKGANSFFGLFGEPFRRQLQLDEVLEGETTLQMAIEAFLELGHLRNQLTHEDIIQFALNKTSQEIYTLYLKGNLFIIAFPQLLQAYIELLPDDRDFINGETP